MTHDNEVGSMTLRLDGDALRQRRHAGDGTRLLPPTGQTEAPAPSRIEAGRLGGPSPSGCVDWASAQRVTPCTFQGRAAFAKRTARARPGEKAVLLLFAPLVRRVVTGSAAFCAVRRAPRPSFEVQRLLELRRSGERVPSVLAFDDAVLVVESAGEPLDRWLKTLPSPAERRSCLVAAAADLGRFHARGHWHGGAQLRNIGVSADGFARFDFDRDLDRHYPVAMLQAFDIALFVSSLAGVEDDDGLQCIVAAYLAAAPAAVRPVLGRCTRLVRWVAGSALLRLAAPKEARRLRALVVALDAVPPVA